MCIRRRRRKEDTVSSSFTSNSGGDRYTGERRAALHGCIACGISYGSFILGRLVIVMANRSTSGIGISFYIRFIDQFNRKLSSARRKLYSAMTIRLAQVLRSIFRACRSVDSARTNCRPFIVPECSADCPAMRSLAMKRRNFLELSFGAAFAQGVPAWDARPADVRSIKPVSIDMHTHWAP